MMRRVFLLRHAEAVPLSQDGDQARPLSERGKKDAAFMGRYLRHENLIPDLVLVSPSRRTLQSSDHVLEALGDVEVRQEASIYNALPEQLLDLIQETSSSVHGVLLIGHNPGFEDLARAMVGHGDRYAYARLMQNFPPASLAVIDFAVDDWHHIALRQGRLDRFVTPER